MFNKKNLKSTLGIRLAEKDRALLENYAQHMGLSSSSLVRMWIKEKLQESQQQK